MKKKSRKPKEYLIESVLQELKSTPDDDAIVVGPDGIRGDESVVVSPDGIRGEDSYSSGHQDIGTNTFLNGESSKAQPAGKTLSPSSKDSAADDPSNDRTVLLGQTPGNSVVSTPAATSKTPFHQEKPSSQGDETEVFAPRKPSENEKAKKADPRQLPENDKTKVASPRQRIEKEEPKVPFSEEPKVSFGGGKGKVSPYEAQFAQAENLKLAQQRILELEKVNEDLRKENEVLSSASEITRQKMDELVAQLYQLEKQKQELRATNESELQIFKDGLSAKESENLRLRAKVEELESRLSKDLRKVRVRERELENRLELSKAEKAALLRAKDEAILDLKRKNENFEVEIERYQNRIIELGQKIELNQEQFARTVRALRLALTNLEVSDGTSSSITLAPLKKAE